MRVRVTTASVLVVGLALVAGSVALIVVLRHSLTDNVETSAQLRAEDVAEIIEAGTAPTDLTLESEEDLFVQVLDRDGRVIAASPNLDDENPVANLGPGETAEVRAPGVDDGEFLVVADRPDRPRVTVLVGRSLESVSETTRDVTGVLLVGIPLLLVVVGATGWFLAGRALRPVEAIRSGVAGISAAELHRRVPEPPVDDEVGRLARTMNEMLDRLEAAQIRQRRFVSDASHELRSPVATIRQHAEVARSHPERTALDDLADTVLAEDLRLERLVDDLLWLARADEYTLDLRRRPVDLDDLVLEEARRLQATTGLRIDTTGVSAGQVLGDRAQLRRLLRNLTDNAARHANDGLDLSVVEDDGVVIVRVDDDGSGIGVDDRGRVFERFVRLDDARARDHGGSGLGLAIVAEIAAAHGGSVGVTDAPSGGARFEVRLPAVPA